MLKIPIIITNIGFIMLSVTCCRFFSVLCIEIGLIISLIKICADNEMPKECCTKPCTNNAERHKPATDGSFLFIAVIRKNDAI
jgi:hypothetical protein